MNLNLKQRQYTILENKLNRGVSRLRKPRLNDSAMYLVFLILHDPAWLEYKDIYPFSKKI